MAVGIKVGNDNQLIFATSNLPIGDVAELLAKVAKSLFASFVDEDDAFEAFVTFFIDECATQHPTVSFECKQTARSDVIAHTIVKELIGLG